MNTLIQTNRTYRVVFAYGTDQVEAYVKNRKRDKATGNVTIGTEKKTLALRTTSCKVYDITQGKAEAPLAETKVRCFSNDNFCRRTGRGHAMKKLAGHIAGTELVGTVHQDLVARLNTLGAHELSED